MSKLEKYNLTNDKDLTSPHVFLSGNFYKMGRKIPGRKHRGVRDIEKQQALRVNSLKGKINCPPQDPDDQPIPRSLRDLMKFKNQPKPSANKKKLTTQEKYSIPSFKRRQNESDGQYLKRASRMCEVVKKETKYEAKFGVSIRKNERGKIEAVVKRPKDPIEEMLSAARKGAKQIKKRALPKIQEKITKPTNQSEVIIKDFDQFKDEVRFGEQAHAPPKLQIPKRHNNTNLIPPKKQPLLLERIIQTNSHKMKEDKKAKRKNLSMALRRRLEQDQSDVIEAYRRVKKLRNK